jgi:acyl-coenzyme A thioesterase 9
MNKSSHPDPAEQARLPRPTPAPDGAKQPLSERPPSVSSFEEILPFRTDAELRERYLNFFGGLRLGKLLEDFDLSAGRTAYNHAQGWERGLTIVTAACDRIDLLDELRSDRDLRVRASVNWTGRSSMEVGLQVASEEGNGGWQAVARAYFIMVARQGETSAAVNPLVPQTDEEHRRFQEGEQRQQQRRAMAQNNYLKHTPTAEESVRLHRLFLRTKHQQITGVPMHETQRQATLLMHPQSRNIHNKIFGGYLMRQAFELAWNITYLHCRCPPQFVCMDHMYFFQPVEIGAILSFTGFVIHTDGLHLVIEVTTEVIHPQTGRTQTTNICYFTFSALDDFGQPQAVPMVIPHTYEEGLRYLDGAKRLRLGEELRRAKGVRSASKSETP